LGLFNDNNDNDLFRPTWLISYIRSLIYLADVVFAQHHHWPSPFLRHASGQLVIVLFRQLHHGRGTLPPEVKSCTSSTALSTFESKLKTYLFFLSFPDF